MISSNIVGGELVGGNVKNAGDADIFGFLAADSDWHLNLKGVTSSANDHGLLPEVSLAIIAVACNDVIEDPNVLHFDLAPTNHYFSFSTHTVKGRCVDCHDSSLQDVAIIIEAYTYDRLVVFKIGNCARMVEFVRDASADNITFQTTVIGLHVPVDSVAGCVVDFVRVGAR